jgi:hypothetical protein
MVSLILFLLKHCLVFYLEFPLFDLEIPSEVGNLVGRPTVKEISQILQGGLGFDNHGQGNTFSLWFGFRSFRYSYYP